MAAAEAREHLAAAEKALHTSWVSLKFQPDFVSAAMDFSQAATKFRAAGQLSDAVSAWLRAAQSKEAQHDSFGAGRCHESAAAICDSQGSSAEAAKHWESAIKCFRLCGKVEVAVQAMLKVAALREKQGDVDAAQGMFEDSVAAYEDENKDYNLSEVYKQYIALLVRHGRTEDAIKAIDGHAAVLARLQQWPFVHKELLSKVVLHLHAQDVVRAEQALTPSMDVTGWFSSQESMLAYDLVDAFKQNDPERLSGLLKSQILTFLPVEVARVAQRQLRIPTLTGGVSGGGAQTPAVLEEEDRAAMLM